MHYSDRAQMSFVIRDIRNEADAARNAGDDSRADGLLRSLEIMQRRFPEMFEDCSPSLAANTYR